MSEAGKDTHAASNLKHTLERVPTDILLETLAARNSQSIDSSIDNPANDNATDLASVVMVSQSQLFSGPVPPPDVLARYNEISPDLAERIVAMAESEQQHRHHLQRSALNSNVTEISRGQHYAFGLCVISLVGSIVLIAMGHSTAGTIFASATVTGLASLFIRGRQHSRRSKSDGEKENQ